MSGLILADASCLIVLDNIGYLHILERMFGSVAITPQIAAEFNKPLPRWIQVISPQNTDYLLLLETFLDPGESGAIALAVEHKGSLLILDDLKARKYAALINLKITGTPGVIIEAKRKGVISAVKPLLDKMKMSRFRLSPEIEKTILNLADE